MKSTKETLIRYLYYPAMTVALLGMLQTNTVHAQSSEPQAVTASSVESDPQSQEELQTGYIGAVRYEEKSVENIADYANWYDYGELIGQFIIPIIDFDSNGNEYTKYTLTINTIIGKYQQVSIPTANRLPDMFFNDQNEFLRAELQEKIINYLLGPRFDLKMEDIGVEPRTVTIYVTRDLRSDRIGAQALPVLEHDKLEIQLDRGVLGDPRSSDNNAYATVHQAIIHELQHLNLGNIEVPNQEELGLPMRTFEEAFATYVAFAVSVERDPENSIWSTALQNVLPGLASDYVSVPFKPEQYDTVTYSYFGIFEQMRLTLGLSRLSFLSEFDTAYKQLVEEGEISENEEFPVQHINRPIKTYKRIVKNLGKEFSDTYFWQDLLISHAALVGSQHLDDDAYELLAPYKAEVDALTTLENGPVNKMNIHAAFGDRIEISIPQKSDTDTVQWTYADVHFTNPHNIDITTLYYTFESIPTFLAIPNNEGVGRSYRGGDGFKPFGEARFVSFGFNQNGELEYTLRIAIAKSDSSDEKIILTASEAKQVYLPLIEQSTVVSTQ